MSGEPQIGHVRACGPARSHRESAVVQEGQELWLKAGPPLVIRQPLLGFDVPAVGWKSTRGLEMLFRGGASAPAQAERRGTRRSAET